VRGSEYHRSRQVQDVSITHPNKPMHPTADTLLVINSNHAGRRVMPSVRLLWYFKTMTETRGWQRRAALSQSGAPLSLGAALRIIIGGASREVRRFEYRGSREVPDVSRAHPNKPMHPTANTKDFKFLNLAGRRVIGGVMLLHMDERYE
jgi:hypothetical protein